MTYFGGFGCLLIAIGPCLTLFLTSVANDPVKIILFIARIADHSLKVVSIANGRDSCQQTSASILRSQKSHSSQSDDQCTPKSESSGGRCITNANQENLRLLDANQSTDNRHPSHMGLALNLDVVAYVSGLGFGLTNALVHFVVISSDLFEPGIYASKWELRLFFFVSSLENMSISLIQIFWSLILYKAFARHAYGFIIFVYFAHMGLTCLSLLSTYSHPWPELVCSMYIITLVGFMIFSYLYVHTFRIRSVRSTRTT